VTTSADLTTLPRQNTNGESVWAMTTAPAGSEASSTLSITRAAKPERATVQRADVELAELEEVRDAAQRMPGRSRGTWTKRLGEPPVFNAEVDQRGQGHVDRCGRRGVIAHGWPLQRR
jgi:hypothetical protein